MNKKNGIIEVRDKEDALLSKITYVDGIKEGEAIMGNSHNKDLEYCTYRDDVKQGKYTIKNSEGRVIEEGYYMGGKKNGKFTKYEKGMADIREEGFYKDNLIDGVVTGFFDNRKISLDTYQDGVLEGKSYEYWSAYGVYSECVFRRGVKTGWEYFYSPNEELIRKIKWDNDTIVDYIDIKKELGYLTKLKKELIKNG